MPVIVPGTAGAATQPPARPYRHGGADSTARVVGGVLARQWLQLRITGHALAR